MYELTLFYDKHPLNLYKFLDFIGDYLESNFQTSAKGKKKKNARDTSRSLGKN